MYIYGAAYLFLVFFGFADGLIPGLGKWDELVTMGIVAYYAMRCLSSWKTSRDVFAQLLLLVSFVFVGIFGNVLNPGLQPSLVAKVKDIVAICKFPLVMILLTDIGFKGDKEKLIRYLAKISRWIAVVSFIAALVGYVVDIGMYTQEIRMLKCLKLYYPHPTYLVASYVLVLAMLIAESIDKNRVYIILTCVVVFLAQRTKGYVSVLLAAVFLVMGDKRIKDMVSRILKHDGSKVRIRFRKILPIILLALVVIWIAGRQKIQAYLSWGMTAARPALYLVGIQLAIASFPFGSGLGTFASWVSGEYYSNVYDLYGISRLRGLTREKFNYIADVFWPSIYGQYGIAGLFLFIYMIYSFIKNSIRYACNDQVMVSALFLWVYILFASTAEAFFMDTQGLQYALFFMICLGVRKKSNG